jgi:hypothetical protein
MMIQATTQDVASVQRIALVPSILEAVAQLTGLRFTCIARVTPDTWTACAVRDQLGLGLLPYDTLDVATTFCGEVMATGVGIAVDAASDHKHWQSRSALSFHDLESFISVPIRGSGGTRFGTLCGFDSEPAALSGTAALASMSLFSELISQQLQDERAAEDMQESLRLKLRHETTLPQVFSQVVDGLRGAYPQRDIVLQLSGSAPVFCDAGRLAQLCFNLVKNALVFGDAAAPVAVSVRINDNQVQLAVTNHGPQLSADTMARVFKPFWRAPAAMPHEGLGLGLFVASEIARAHGGAVSVTSSAPLTTFMFTLNGGRSLDLDTDTAASAPLFNARLAPRGMVEQ